MRTAFLTCRMGPIGKSLLTVEFIRVAAATPRDPGAAPGTAPRSTGGGPPGGRGPPPPPYSGPPPPPPPSSPPPPFAGLDVDSPPERPGAEARVHLLAEGAHDPPIGGPRQ